MKEEALVLEGMLYGYESKGVRLDLQKYRPRGYQYIYIRQFLAEGTFPSVQTHLEGISSFEVVDMGSFVAEVKELALDGGRVAVDWETRHEGNRIFFSVYSAVSKEETLAVVRSLSPIVK